MAKIDKYTLAEQVIRILHGGNPSDDSRMDVREVALFVEQAFSSILRRRLFENKEQSNQEVNGSYIYTFKNVEVLEDEDLKLYYSELPATAVDMPNEIGMQYVGYMQDQKNPFIKVSHTFCALFKGSMAGKLQGNVGYYVEGDRVYYINWDQGTETCKVLIKMVVSSLEGDGNDAFAIDNCNQFYIPIDMQEEIVMKAVQLYKLHKDIKQDITNDNVDE
jgi:hypothetical protein